MAFNKTYQELGEKAIGGDKKAYAELLGITEKIAYNYLKSRVKDFDSIDDVVQEILISVHKALHTYQPSMPFEPWVYSIINFRFKDYLRKVYRTAEVSTVDLDDVSHLLSTKSDEGKIENEDAVDKALQCLKDKERMIVEALYLEGMSAKEVADKMILTVSDVRTTAHRALKKLKGRVS